MALTIALSDVFEGSALEATNMTHNIINRLETPERTENKRFLEKLFNH